MYDTFWSFEMVDEKKRKEIDDYYKMIKTHLLFDIVLILGTYVIIGPLISFQDVVNYCFNDISPIQWQTIAKVITYFDMIFLMVIILSSLHLFMYYMLHLNIQFRILNHYILNICKGFPKDKSDEFYQTAIYSRLIFCIRHHIRLKRWRLKVMLATFNILFFCRFMKKFYDIYSNILGMKIMILFWLILVDIFLVFHVN